MTRWTLGASDIMFTNPAFSTFFRKSETFRGTSVPARNRHRDQKLRTGAWASTGVCQKAATPWKYLPRRCARLSVTFGAPVSLAAVHGAMTRSDVVPGEAAEAQEEERRREDGERVVEALGRQASRIYTTAKEDIKGASYTLNS
ncbi:hypothetical protein EDB85DRAFT_2153172 [Lactarius pseudohatsudake]|nr:hypothetical protein EDB85DRAFT_2153172 [Lactarius pseudohatsudake]